MQKCKVCGVNKPDHQIERLWNNGKRIIVCQNCTTDDDINLAYRFSCISGVPYDKLLYGNVLQ